MRKTEKHNQILDDIQKKFKEGEKRYGKFAPKTDTRNFGKECYNEGLDMANYLGMWGLQLNSQYPDVWVDPELSDWWYKIYGQVFNLLCEILEFEQKVENLKIQKGGVK